MNVLVESRNTSYNWGDASMLEVTLSRLVRLFPEADITLLNHESSGLDKRYGCRADGVKAERTSWMVQRPLWSRLGRGAPHLVDRLYASQPRLWEQVSRVKMRVLGHNVARRDAFLRLFDRADVLVLSGGGFIADPFDSVDQAFSLIQLARTRNVPVFLFGQGIGPLRDARLLERARYTLPHVEQIAVRERRSSRPLLRRLGVPEEKVVVTGDDAVAQAHPERPEAPGSAIGVNLRVASYSEVGEELIERLATVLQEASSALQAPLLPVPIAFRGDRSDVDSIQRILAGCGIASDGGAALGSLPAVIRQVGRCRVVVTGSYHAGVFALSQGLPVVALSQSQYYDNKFRGLADQFGVGCRVLRTDRSDVERVLPQAIRDAWEQAEALRPALMEAAQRQIERAEAAYRHMARTIGG